MSNHPSQTSQYRAQVVLIRQWSILRILHYARDGMNVYSLAKQFDVTSSTIYRDLDVLKLAGFPIDRQGGKDSCRWFIRARHDRKRNPAPYLPEMEE